MNNLQQQAIEAALECDWERAIDYNIAIINDNPENIQALNRLAKSYMELGQKDQAKEAYIRVLSLDKYNSVATKSLNLLPQKSSSAKNISTEDFIEKPGLTKSVRLIKLASKGKIAETYIKQNVILRPQGRLVAVITSDNNHIGSLPDDISFKIQRLLKKKYQYAACVKSCEEKRITIFIREIKRTKRYQDMPSFAASLNHQALKK